VKHRLTTAAGLVLFLMTAGGLRADLQEVKAEQNLEKRSKLALENADQALKDARAAYGRGEFKQTGALLSEVQESVQIAEEALQETGKNPRKRPKWFKRAEIRTRDLLRKMESFREEMSVVDRPMLEKVMANVQKVHDQLLSGIMEGKSK
jgi:type II secretory pathway pseudopilin PulG